MNIQESGRPGDPKLAVDPREPNQDLVTCRAGIITNVFADGLKSSTALIKDGISYIGSADGDPWPFVSGCILPNPSLPKNGAHHTFNDVLYDSPYSVLRVIIEREYGMEDIDSPKEDLIDKYQKRLSASLLVIYAPSDEGDYGEKAFVWEEREVTPNMMIAIIVPNYIWVEYCNASSVRPQNPIRVIPVADTIRKEIINGTPYPLEMPNFEEPLMEFLDETNGRFLVVHGVRLPIEEDLVRLPRSAPPKAD